MASFELISISELITQPFMENPLIAIAHPDHPLLKNKKNSIKALSKETLITEL
jgi:DNA-binding transcriptional LysR family regulator